MSLDQSPYPQPVVDELPTARRMTGEYEDSSFLPGTNVRIWYTHLNTCYPIHWHNAMEILVGEKEHYVCEIKGVSYHVMPGDILMIPAGELHSLSPADGCNGFVYLLDLDFLKHIPSAARLTSALSRPRYITAENSPSLHMSIYALLRKMREDYFSQNNLRELLVDASILLMVEQLLHHHMDEATAHSRFDKRREYNDLFRKVVAYINQHYMEDLSLQTLARQHGVSMNHFSRLFKEYTQYSFRNYLTLCRVNAAERLMADARLSITDIAYRVGYNGSAAFSRAFHEFKGCSPSEYRQIHVKYLRKGLSGQG